MDIRLTPSKAHRFFTCSASLLHEKPYVETPWTIRGKNLHTLAQLILARDANIQAFITEKELNAEEVASIEGYVVALQSLEAQFQAPLAIEKRQYYDFFGNRVQFVADALLVDELNQAVAVVDLKTGRTPVEVINNEQLLCYAYALAQRYPRAEQFFLAIYQNNELKPAKATREYVLNYFKALEPHIRDINAGVFKYEPSEKACRYCDYVEECPIWSYWNQTGEKVTLYVDANDVPLDERNRNG